MAVCSFCGLRHTDKGLLIGVCHHTCSWSAQQSRPLAGASVEGGPIDESYVHEAAEFVCYANERFVHSRRHLADTDLRTCYELNLGVPAWKGRPVPFGTAGYAWIPESLHASRGGKHVMGKYVSLCCAWGGKICIPRFTRF